MHQWCIFCIIVDINSHLRVLCVALISIQSSQWLNLGIHLGLPYYRLKAIEKDCENVNECMFKILEEWLEGHGGDCTKLALVKALLNIDCKMANRLEGKHVIVYSITE